MSFARYFTLLLVFASLTLHAQSSLTFFGEVRDTLGVPLQFANVMAVDTTTQKMAGFAVTNPEGRFRIRLEAGKVYQLKITYIGYSPFEQLIQPTAPTEAPILFILTANITELGAVEIVAEMPVTIKGDTIVYEVEAFNQGNERKLEDVLEDLPGFQIEENGEIKVQGKKVDKVLVDGKEFFDGDSKLATKNIPAHVVDKVQLLQNFNDISPLSAVNGSEQLALNVQLKEDKKQIVFGDVTAGVGDRERYYGHLNAFYYDKKTNLNLIADGNNIGELAFTMNDYFRFAGGMGSLLQGRGSTFEMSSDQLGIPRAERNSARTLDNQLGAFNFSLQPRYGWRLNGFAIGSWVDNTFGSLSSRTYLQESTTLAETFSSRNFVESTSGLGKIGLTYTPNYNLHLDYKAFVRTAQITNGSDQLSQVDAVSNDINETSIQSPWALEQQLNGYYALGEKNVLSLQASHKLQHQDPLYDLITSRQPFAGSINLVNATNYQLTQERIIDTDRTEVLGNYYRILNRTNHVNFSVGQVWNRQQYDAQLYQDLETGNVALDQDTYGNRAEFGLSDSFVGLTYRNKLGKLTWSPQLNLHYYQMDFSQRTGEEGFERWMLLPALNTKYELSSSHSINASYSLNAQFMDVQQLVSNRLVNSYNSLSMGNPELINSWYHSFNLDYRNFKMYNFFNLYGGLSYQRKLDDIQNAFQLNAWERISIPVNVLPVNEQASGYLNAEQRFDHFRVSVDGNWSYSLIHNQLGDLPNVNTNFRQQYQGLIATRLWEQLSLRLTHEVTVNQYEGNQNSSRFLNHETIGRMNWKVLKGLRLIGEYAYNQYFNQASNIRSHYDLLDLSIQYRKEGSPWEFAVKGMNVLNTTNIRRDSFSDNLISTYSYDIQRRYTVLTVMYDL